MAGSSAAERPYHPSGSANGNGKPRMPGTPQRRETMSSLSHAREKAVQDPGLKDYVCFLPLGLGSRFGGLDATTRATEGHHGGAGLSY